MESLGSLKEFVLPLAKIFKKIIIMRKISINVSDYTSGSYLVEIKGCYDDVMQTKIVKL